MSISIQRILFPTDFSEASTPAFEYAVMLAGRFEAQLELVTVVEDIILTEHMSVTVVHVDEILEDLDRAAAKRLAELQSRVPEGIRSSVAVVRGTPFLEILRCAKRDKADLIVMGTHGRTGLSHVLMGSTAEKVVRKSSCPVLTVKPPGQRFEHP